jgi:nucleoside-diphosphate kinase
MCVIAYLSWAHKYRNGANLHGLQSANQRGRQLILPVFCRLVVVGSVCVRRAKAGSSRATIMFGCMERTFAIIKPDAVKKGFAGRILARIEEAGFTVRAMRMIRMSKREAEGFYYVHKDRPFFGGLTDFMSSGPCIVMCLESTDAIRKWRELMGATDPAKAASGTMRKEFGASIDNNATHGSDAPETAAFEIAYFFRGMELA